MERIKLNLIPSGVAPVVHLSQYDEGRKFGIDLFEGDSVYVLDGTETLTVNSRKPDGHVIVISVTNTGSSSLEVETVEQLTAVHGTSYAKLKIEKGSDVIATLEFLIAVSRDPLENGDPSESFVDNLNTQIAQAVSEQYDSANVVFDPAPTTGHGTGFAVTSEGVKTAIDNAIGGLSIPDELNDLSDVDTTTPTQGEALVWDGTKWVNGTVSTVGNLDDLNDVDTTGKQEGDSLRYIGNEWKAKPTTVKMTQAEYNAIVDFTPYANTHIVITDAPNLNPTASDIEYSSGVSVADELTKIGTTHQLLNQALTTTNTEYSTTYSRKFSDYDLLIFRIGYGADNIRRTVVLPTNNWYSGANINEGILHGASSSRASDYDITNIVISYESDTSVKAYVGGEGLINTLKIFAIKL